MISRRSFLTGSVAALAGVPLTAAALSGMASGATLGRAARPNTAGLPMTIVNRTGGYANSSIWFFIVGTDLSSGRQAFVAPDGTLTPVSLSDNGSDGWADLSIPLAGSGNTSFTLPPDMSGRIYFSINDKIRFKVVTDGNGHPALQYPAGWVPSDPSYHVLHDCVEFTYNGSGMYCDTTMVDMFSIPLAITLVGAQNQTTGTLVSDGRNNIFAAISSHPDFAQLVVNNNMRVIAPGHGIDVGLFSSTYLDSMIQDVWDHYTSNTLTVTTNSGTYTGQVSGGQLRFSGGVAPFAKPTTQNVFYCNGALTAPNDGLTGPVAAVLGAGFNRSTLLANASQPATDASTFYQSAPTNYYAQAMHANTVDGKAYGFPFDDVAGFASYVQDGAPTSFTITLTPF